MSENKLKVSNYALSPWPKELMQFVENGGYHHVLIPLDPQPKSLGDEVWEYGDIVMFAEFIADEIFHNIYGGGQAKGMEQVEVGNIHPVTTGYGIVPDDAMLEVTDIKVILESNEGVWYWELEANWVNREEVQHE